MSKKEVEKKLDELLDLWAEYERKKFEEDVKRIEENAKNEKHEFSEEHKRKMEELFERARKMEAEKNKKNADGK